MLDFKINSLCLILKWIFFAWSLFHIILTFLIFILPLQLSVSSNLRLNLFWCHIAHLLEKVLKSRWNHLFIYNIFNGLRRKALKLKLIHKSLSQVLLEKKIWCSSCQPESGIFQQCETFLTTWVENIFLTQTVDSMLLRKAQNLD